MSLAVAQGTRSQTVITRSCQNTLVALVSHAGDYRDTSFVRDRFWLREDEWDCCHQGMPAGGPDAGSYRASCVLSFRVETQASKVWVGRPSSLGP